MAKNHGADGRRYGAVKGRVQFQDPKTKMWCKQNAYTGEVMQCKKSEGEFRGIASVDHKLTPNEYHELPKKAK